MAKGKIQLKLQVNTSFKGHLLKGNLALAVYKNNTCCETDVYGQGGFKKTWPSLAGSPIDLPIGSPTGWPSICHCSFDDVTSDLLTYFSCC